MYVYVYVAKRSAEYSVECRLLDCANGGATRERTLVACRIGIGIADEVHVDDSLIHPVTSEWTGLDWT